MFSIVWKILLGLFVLDIFRRGMEKPKNVAPKNDLERDPAHASPKNNYEEDLGEINTALDDDDEDEDEDNDEDEDEPEKKEEEEETEDEEEKPTKKRKKDKKQKKKSRKAKKKKHLIKKTIYIRYDKSYQKQFDKLQQELTGNYTNIKVVGEDYGLPPWKQLMGKVAFFTQIGVSFLIFASSNLKEKITFIPKPAFDYIEKNKWAVMIGNFLFHTMLRKYLSSSGAFEVMLDGVTIVSKLKMGRIPRVGDIAVVLIEKGIVSGK